MPVVANSLLSDNKHLRITATEAKHVQLRRSIEAVSGAKFGAGKIKTPVHETFQKAKTPPLEMSQHSN